MNRNYLAMALSVAVVIAYLYKTDKRIDNIFSRDSVTSDWRAVDPKWDSMPDEPPTIDEQPAPKPSPPLPKPVPPKIQPPKQPSCPPQG